MPGHRHLSPAKIQQLLSCYNVIISNMSRYICTFVYKCTFIDLTITKIFNHQNSCYSTKHIHVTELSFNQPCSS